MIKLSDIEKLDPASYRAVEKIIENYEDTRIFLNSRLAKLKTLEEKIQWVKDHLIFSESICYPTENIYIKKSILQQKLKELEELQHGNF